MQESQRRIDSVLGSMVLINPSKIFKYERDQNVKSLMEKGIHRLADIKLNKCFPDETPMTLKDPVRSTGSGEDVKDQEISLLNLTVKKMNQSINRSRRHDTNIGFDPTIQSAVLEHQRKAKSSQGFRHDYYSSQG